MFERTFFARSGPGGRSESSSNAGTRSPPARIRSAAARSTCAPAAPRRVGMPAVSRAGLCRPAAGALLLPPAVAAPAAPSVPRAGRYLVVLEDGRTTKAVRGTPAAIRALRRDPAVESVSPEYTR